MVEVTGTVREDFEPPVTEEAGGDEDEQGFYAEHAGEPYLDEATVDGASWAERPVAVLPAERGVRGTPRGCRRPCGRRHPREVRAARSVRPRARSSPPA